ncbi:MULTISPECIES: hypothetical protein [unclassified Streptomyces]|uniref:hypothetical protein n=1 Tax=unclassified Streptomyces TaxID=2593676 RepID=UPI0022522B07|nr:MULTISPECIES: hypothetical protein [unclassified Streptomyces]MCX4794307.1 hypothetical protein [Streptomyces sp. NBC_01242]WSP58215.1 hypothetical protein OG306_30405 [Streptomyces sp. NBC_01241]WSP62124.1 hypothetical protein OG466_09625 [Streptomyces sp. NBC_01240]
MTTRSTVLTAAIAAAAALTATGSTFTSAATNEPPQAAPVVQRAVAAPAPAPAPAVAPKDRGDTGKSDEGRGNGESRGNDEGRGGNGEGRGNDEGRGNQGRGDDEGRGGDERGGDQDRGHGGRGYGGRDYDEGRIHFNERTYSASPGGCVSVASGLGSTSFNIFNESRRTVEVFSGATCDNGAPVAVVGPHGATEGVFPNRVEGGVFVSNGVGGSFRVIGNDYDY